MATVQQIMMNKGPDVIVAAADTTVRAAARLMSQATVGSIVIREGGRVKGIFTERDLLRRVVAAGKDPDAITLGEVMSSPVESCTLSDDVRRCGARLAEGNMRHLAVIEDGALIGVIGIRDILAAELRESEEALRSLERETGP